MGHDTKLVFVDLLESLDQRGYDINEDMPHFKLSTQPGIISEDERQIAVANLRKALAFSLSNPSVGIAALIMKRSSIFKFDLLYVVLIEPIQH